MASLCREIFERHTVPTHNEPLPWGDCEPWEDMMSEPGSQCRWFISVFPSICVLLVHMLLPSILVIVILANIPLIHIPLIWPYIPGSCSSGLRFPSSCFFNFFFPSKTCFPCPCLNCLFHAPLFMHIIDLCQLVFSSWSPVHKSRPLWLVVPGWWCLSFSLAPRHLSVLSALWLPDLLHSLSILKLALLIMFFVQIWSRQVDSTPMLSFDLLRGQFESSNTAPEHSSPWSWP